jgi:toxin ParE1/3/4
MHALHKHPLVEGDLAEAAFWYHEREAEVAVRLVDETRLAMFAAAKHPFHFLVCFGTVRRVRVRHFPHSVFFEVRGQTVFVLAVLHGAREVEKLVLERKS